jgi:hypothetical protein
MGLFDNKTTATGGTSTSVGGPGMADILSGAMYQYNKGSAWAPDTSSHVTPFAAQTQQALKQGANIATGSQGAFDQNFNRVSATLNAGGLNPLQQQQVGRLQGIAGGNGLNPMQQAAYDQYGSMMTPNGLNAMQQQGAGWLENIAGGKEMQNNPYLEDLIQRGSGDIADSNNLMASLGGRYGSGSHEGVLQKNIGDFSGNLRFQDYNNQLQRRDAAIGDYAALGGAGFGQRAGLVGQQANLATTGFDQRNEALAALYNAGGTERANNLAGAGQLSDAYNARIMPSTTLGKIGGAYEGLNQKVLDDKSRIFGETQRAQLGPIEWLNSVANPYKTSTQTNTTTSKPINDILTGAGQGYDLFGWPGAITGGVTAALR